MSTSLLFQGVLHKQPTSSQGEPIEEKFRLRFFTLGREELVYFLDQAAFEQGVPPLGSIAVKEISSLEIKNPLNAELIISDQKRLWLRANAETELDSLLAALKTCGVEQK